MGRAVLSAQQEWHVLAVFETHEQAKQAALHFHALKPRAYVLVAVEHGQVVWQEWGDRYGAIDVRL